MAAVKGAFRKERPFFIGGALGLGYDSADVW
jgi:hypothetical protein